MKRLGFIGFLLVLLGVSGGCGRRDSFCIEGCIVGADSMVLYLEQLTLGEGAVAIDSVRLSEDGGFAFREAAPADGPEFYRLRIGRQAINLGIDSTETVRVDAELADMSFGYKVRGSGACDTIRLLCLRMADLERAARRISADRSFTVAERDSMIGDLLDRYKAGVKRDFIQGHFATLGSYYACFQTFGPQLVFNPMLEKSDMAWMGAVGNAWSERYPMSPRTENLTAIIRQARRHHAKPREIVLDIDGDKVRELGIIDMTFPDIHGQERTLSDLGGQVVLLDFMAFQLEGSAERTLLLRELYEKYHGRGLEIYQVSLDASHHLWKQRSEALPWVSVWCEEGLESDMLELYAVEQLPCFFLIDRNCDLQARQEDIADLEQAIVQLL